jgi:protein-disulfide isomerase/tetratricopeptide (TPR) repeat protein
LKIELQREDVVRRSANKRNRVRDGRGNGRAWRLMWQLAILQVCFLALRVAPALAQHEGHEGHEVVGWVPREILERPLPLRRDIGNLHEKVTTTSAEAQAFYDQGLDYLSSYVWIEAARSFHQALRLDSSLAAAYVGLCDVYVQLQDVAAVRAALEKAQALSSRITEAERQRMEIRARQVEFLEDKQNLDKFVAYRKAIYDALMANPLDPGLWILRGFADEGPGAGHGQTGDLDSIAFYQTALAVSPGNSAAHHYLAHSYENIGRTEEALYHSEAYLRLASSIPHAHHMRGHELRRAGRIEDAIEEFRKANELENAYYRAEHIPAEYDWHRPHNLSLLAMCYQLLGQMKVAEQLLRESFALPAHGEFAEFGHKQWPEFLLARGRPQEAYDQSQILTQSPSMMARFAGHTLMGRALVAMDRVNEAEKEMALAREALVLVPAADADRLRPYSETLRAEILLSQKKSAEGVALMKEIEEQLRASPGPDARSQALIELDSIARRARDTEEWALAELTAQEMIQQDPSYAGGYYATGLVAEHEGNSVKAIQQFSIAEKLWSEADKELPELQIVRQKLTAEQTKFPATRQQYLKRLGEHGAVPTPLQRGKVEVSFDPARLRGSPNVSVIIVEFSDFQCPFCRKVQPTLKSLLAKYEGRVSLAYRDFPLRGMHGQAELGAESSRCAGEQGKFWEYHDLLFENPDKLNRNGLLELARNVKLDERQFDSCLSSGKYRAQVERDLQDGIRAGVMGTPGIFINGILLGGAQPAAAFERVIESELASVKEKRAGH